MCNPSAGREDVHPGDGVACSERSKPWNRDCSSQSRRNGTSRLSVTRLTALKELDEYVQRLKYCRTNSSEASFMREWQQFAKKLRAILLTLLRPVLRSSRSSSRLRSFSERGKMALIRKSAQRIAHTSLVIGEAFLASHVSRPATAPPQPLK